MAGWTILTRTHGITRCLGCEKTEGGDAVFVVTAVIAAVAVAIIGKVFASFWNRVIPSPRCDAGSCRRFLLFCCGWGTVFAWRICPWRSAGGGWSGWVAGAAGVAGGCGLCGLLLQGSTFSVRFLAAAASLARLWRFASLSFTSCMCNPRDDIPLRRGALGTGLASEFRVAVDVDGVSFVAEVDVIVFLPAALVSALPCDVEGLFGRTALVDVVLGIASASESHRVNRISVVINPLAVGKNTQRIFILLLFCTF